MTEEEIINFLSRTEKEKSKVEKEESKVKKVCFPELIHPQGIERMKIGFDYFNEIVLSLEVQIGQASIKVGEILELNCGSIIELDKAAGEPADILVNGQRFARGEVIVIGNNFGARIDSIYEDDQGKGVHENG